MLLFTFVQNSKVLAFPGGVAAIGEVAKTAGYKKALIVHGHNVKKTGVIDNIIAMLSAAGVESCCFDKVEPDPPAPIVDEGGAFVREQGCDCIIAVGGGSAIDMAKAINVLRKNDGSILEYIGKPYNPVDGLIAIPTTSGTGSEVSTAAVITDTVNDLKCVLATAVPDYVILDPTLTVTMPANQTLYTGLDAFSHVAEGYTSIANNMIMDPICEKAMEMIVENLPLAVKDGTNMEARTKMHAAATLGGFALTNALAHVGHSLAHVVGAKTHIVHGALCGYGLPEVMKHLAPAMPHKIKKIGEIVGAVFDGTETPDEIAEKAGAAYKAFTASVGLPPVTEWNKTYDVDALADLVLAEPLAPLCPVPVTKEAAVTMLNGMLAL